MVESKKCLGGQKRSSALLVRVCCCLLCISNLPWASRPTPLKTFEQHLSAALWWLGRGLSPFCCALGPVLVASSFALPFLSLSPFPCSPHSRRTFPFHCPGPARPLWQTTRFLPLSMFVIGSPESLPCSCSPVKDLSLSLSDTAPSRNHQQTRGSFLDSLLSCLYVPCSLWHLSPLCSTLCCLSVKGPVSYHCHTLPLLETTSELEVLSSTLFLLTYMSLVVFSPPHLLFLHCDACQSRNLSPSTATHCPFAFPGELEVFPSCHPPFSTCCVGSLSHQLREDRCSPNSFFSRVVLCYHGNKKLHQRWR